ncbi:putative bzip transcription factor [Erysiphe neolycopersici]|uniref:Putative bzip transcription factor n=1 Tax=Erysiphe neolycopersici TaxID=212602 RepID=A0A420I8F4_9PEZI|nr:putative bzip transcription factor [Erysiphe neolycopersici]
MSDTSVNSPSDASSRQTDEKSLHDRDSPVIHDVQSISRPQLATRKSSGTIIVPREHPHVELREGEEEFDEDDARAMSPRRNSRDIEKMSEEAREQLQQHAKLLQKSLLDIFVRIEAVKEEHDKLDNNNKFLQKYIGNLMSTSKITSGGTRKK